MSITKKLHILCSVTDYGVDDRGLVPGRDRLILIATSSILGLEPIKWLPLYQPKQFCCSDNEQTEPFCCRDNEQTEPYVTSQFDRHSLSFYIGDAGFGYNVVPRC
jgi:hypothetical protein